MVDILVKVGTAIVLANLTDHAPATENNLGTRTHQLDLTGLASGAARQSDIIDLGENRAARHTVRPCLEMDVAVIAGSVVSLHWAPSPSATPATANPGGVSGSDSAYTGYSSNLAESIGQLQPIAPMFMTPQIAPIAQQAAIGTFESDHRYGSLVVYNETDQAFEDDAIEMSVLIEPIVDTTV